MRGGISYKIKTINDLAEIVAQLKREKKKIVLCHGVFDLLHPGHIKHFESAKQKGDILVVTVTKDEYVNKGPGRPIFNQTLRAESVASIECIDYVAINEWPTAVEAIKKLKPNFYVKGEDYTDKTDDVTGKIYEEEQAIKSVGGLLHFTHEVSFSSTSLINTYFTPYPEEVRDFLLKFKREYTAKSVISCMKDLGNLKVLIIGDIIIDEYDYCAGMGKTQKDNIISTRYLSEEVFAGGVLAAANHLAGFCRKVALTTSVGGKNDYEDFILSHLKQNIKPNLYHIRDRVTVVKKRFVDPSFLNKMFEICYLDEAVKIPSLAEKKICNYIDAHVREFDVVVVADFGHGLITPKIVDKLCKKAKFLALNTQTNSSNIGFNLVTKFPRADYICIDEPELRLACQDRASNLEKLILKVSKKLRCGRIIITRGHNGSLAYSRKEGFTRIPVFSKQVIDRIGAGDAYFSITAPCTYKNYPMEMVGFIGNAVGAMKVLIVGNRSSVEPVPLFKYITALLK